MSSAALIVFVVFAFLVLMCLSKCKLIRKWVFGETAVEKLVIQMLANPRNTDVHVAPRKAMILSVVYLCENEVSVIREQIACLAHVITNAFHGAVNAEFLCYIPDKWKRIEPHMERLVDQLPLRMFRIPDSNVIHRFGLASAHARGKVVVDARAVCHEISYIVGNLDKRFIRFVRDEGASEAETVPVSGSKDALLAVARGMRLLEEGSFEEMEMLAKIGRIEIDISTISGGERAPKTADWVWKLAKRMYESGYWKIPVKLLEG